MSLVTLRAELTAQEAWHLAQFIKRLRFDQYLELTNGGYSRQDREEQAYTMRAATDKIRQALSTAGYAPR